MFIAFLQVFAIGLGMGFAGPCLFFCLPIIITFTSGVQKGYRKSLIDILIFFCGRLLAYIVLGCLAGISGMFLRRFIDSSVIFYLNPLAGIISIGLGIFILFSKKTEKVKCQKEPLKVGASGGLFLFGFIIGVSPCAPLLALLFEIALISKNALQGAFYGLFFGLGTFISGVIVAAGLAGLLIWIPERFLKSRGARLSLRIVCALVLILFGLWFLLGYKK
jgi:sulfite exporter TauE/SafE